jgi:hypothetical protein
MSYKTELALEAAAAVAASESAREAADVARTELFKAQKKAEEARARLKRFVSEDEPFMVVQMGEGKLLLVEHREHENPSCTIIEVES